MLTTLINFFFPRTVSGVMSSFQKTVDDLNKVAARQLAIKDKAEVCVEKKYEQAYKAEVKAANAANEADKALALAGRITDQFGLNK